APGREDAYWAAWPAVTQTPRSLRHGTRADPVRGFAAGAKPTTAGESVDSPRIGGELPDVKTRAGRRSLS
ncbi:MAG: hypothetical protein ACK56S_19335, partial [Planctomycetota bacterium]